MVDSKRNSILKLLCLILGIITHGFTWADGVNIGGIYYRLSGNKAAVTYTYNNSDWPKVNTYTGDIVIPDTVTYGGVVYRVTEIVDFAFSNSMVRSVVLPESLETIGIEAFEAASQLERIEWNGRNTVVTRRSAFSIAFNATALREFIVGENVETLPASLLDQTSVKVVYYNARNCRSMDCFFGQHYSTITTSTHIDSLIISDQVESIPDYFCNSLDNLKYIQLGQNVRSIGYLAFYVVNSYGEHWPDTLRLPSTLEYVAEAGLPPFKKVVYFPKSLKYCASWGKEVDSVHLQYHIEDLGAWAWMQKQYFYESLKKNDLYSADTLITYLALPDTLTRINSYSFYKARSVQGYHLPDSLRVLGEYALTGLKASDNLILPHCLDTIGDAAMGGCGISDIYLTQDEPFYIGKYALYKSYSEISYFNRVPNIHMSCNGDIQLFKNHKEWKEYTLLPHSIPYHITCNTAYYDTIFVRDYPADIQYNCDNGKSTIVGQSQYPSWCFSHWSDGVTDSVRHLVPTNDMTLVPHFKRCDASQTDTIPDTAYRAISMDSIGCTWLNQSRKVIMDGRLYICVDGITYDSHGRRIK